VSLGWDVAAPVAAWANLSRGSAAALCPQVINKVSAASDPTARESGLEWLRVVTGHAPGGALRPMNLGFRCV